MVAVSGSSEDDTGGRQRASEFQAWMFERFPVLTNWTAMPFDWPFVQLFNSPNAMNDYVKAADYGSVEKPKIGMGIVFAGNDPNNYDYWIRQNSTNYNAPETTRDGRSQVVRTTPDTSRKFSSFSKNDAEACRLDGGAPDYGRFKHSCTGQYLYNGVLATQLLMQDFILEQTGAADAGYNVAEAGVQFAQFPTRPYYADGFFATIEDTAPLLIALGLLYPVAAMISYITREKELRQKELMKMMSVVERDIGWSWFLTFAVFNLVTAVATAWVSTVLYEASDFHILLVFWVLVFLAVTVLSMAMASITTKAARAVLIGLLVFFGGVFLTLAVDYRDGEEGLIAFICLHPVAALSYAIKEIGRLEDQRQGLTGDTIDVTESLSGYTFQDFVRFLGFDSLLWGVVTWYLNRVIRPEYGQAEPLWFLFLPSYWCSGRSEASVRPISNEDVEIQHEGIPYEAVGESLRRQADAGKSIEMFNLRKTYGEKTAVDGLTLSMYSGQITALLGHNGAGKTTTISMLTGATAPTSGQATVAGRDIRTQMPQIRKNIGICLQHDCLFPQLTVREHIQFFSRLKGLYEKESKEEAEKQIDQAILDVALFEKRNTRSKNLSGGMKRKLSVAMAFCGGSSVVLLDEPTSGMVRHSLLL
jgi:ABC-type branched-subunit amino acid transport system ATPase component